LAENHGADYICLDAGTDHGAVIPVSLLVSLENGSPLIDDGDAVCLATSGVSHWVERVPADTPTWIRLWLLQHLESVLDLKRAWLLNNVDDGVVGCELVVDFSWDIPDSVRLDRAMRLVRELSKSGATAQIPGWQGVSYLPMHNEADEHPLGEVPAIFIAARE
jgi:hypothetical protein